MNKTTEKTCNAFLRGEALRVGNTFTDGKRLYLFNNLIAEHKEDGLYITNAGWMTKTTKERLNGLAGVNIHQSKKRWYLNGTEWRGEWIRVNENKPPQVDEERAGKVWNMTQVWKSSDGWRGYYEPVYAVCGANDTGMFYDSPCRSDVAERELNLAKEWLRDAGIPTKQMTCESSNVFCVHHYIVVRPIDKSRAEEVVAKLLRETNTNLLYNCKD